jgi:hypothetical protein
MPKAEPKTLASVTIGIEEKRDTLIIEDAMELSVSGKATEKISAGLFRLGVVELQFESLGDLGRTRKRTYLLREAKQAILRMRDLFPVLSIRTPKARAKPI